MVFEKLYNYCYLIPLAEKKSFSNWSKDVTEVLYFSLMKHVVILLHEEEIPPKKWINLGGVALSGNNRTKWWKHGDRWWWNIARETRIFHHQQMCYRAEFSREITQAAKFLSPFEWDNVCDETNFFFSLNKSLFNYLSFDYLYFLVFFKSN